MFFHRIIITYNTASRGKERFIEADEVLKVYLEGWKINQHVKLIKKSPPELFGITGVVTSIKVKEGDTVEVGSLLGLVSEGGKHSTESKKKIIANKNK